MPLNQILYKNCKECHLSEYRKNVVLIRGRSPAQIVFIGLHPGKSEDARGIAFAGAVGRFFEDYVIDSWNLTESGRGMPDYCMTYLIGCKPVDKYGGNIREPQEQEILKCRNRFSSIMTEVNPALCIFVGKTVEKYLKLQFPESFTIVDPEYLLRTGGKSSPDYLMQCRKLSEAFKYYQKEF